MPTYVPKTRSSRRPYRRIVRRKRRLTNTVNRIVSRHLETHVVSIKATYADLEAASQRLEMLSNVAQGDQPNQRTGAVIAPFRVKGKVAVKMVAAGGPAAVRVLIVKYKQSSGTAPTLAEILPDANADLTTLAVDQPYEDTTGYTLPQSRRRFQIIYDKVKIFSRNSADSSDLLKIWTINKKLTGKTFFTSSLAAQTGNNQYYMFVYTDAANDLLQEQHDIRFYFKDA